MFRNLMLFFGGVFLLITPLLAQNLQKSPNLIKDGKREGDWTVWMDKNWIPTANKDSAVYYRQITYQAGKPIGMVRDHYQNGNVQWEGQLISDQPADVIDGTAIWYYENGQMSEVQEYKNGIAFSSRYLNADGTLDTLNTIKDQGVLYNNKGEYEKAEPLLIA